MAKVKLVIFSLAVLLIFWITLWFRRFGFSNFPKPQTQILPSPAITQNANVEGVSDETLQSTTIIDFGNGWLVTNKVSVNESTTPFDTLSETLQKEQLELKTKRYDFGVFVESVDGFASTADMAWIYFVNTEPGTVAADQYKLKPGDLVEWKYLAPSE